MEIADLGFSSQSYREVKMKNDRIGVWSRNVSLGFIVQSFWGLERLDEIITSATKSYILNRT